MSELLDIDRTMPEGPADSPASILGAGEPVTEVGEESPAPEPKAPKRVRERIRPAGHSDQTPPSPRVVSSRTPPSKEQLSLWAGITLAALFFFIYFGIYQAEENPEALLAYTVVASAVGAVALWFYLRADQLPRVQANFLAGVLTVIGLVFVWQGVDNFGLNSWKMMVAVSLATVATYCFLKAQVVDRI